MKSAVNRIEGAEILNRKQPEAISDANALTQIRKRCVLRTDDREAATHRPLRARDTQQQNRCQGGGDQIQGCCSRRAATQGLEVKVLWRASFYFCFEFVKQ